MKVSPFATSHGFSVRQLWISKDDEKADCSLSGLRMQLFH